ARLLDTAPEGERLREGALLVIAGRPNAGKSSLFNALLGTERAIVTELPGTTRDAVEAHAVLEGFPFRLVDTAGLRDSDDRIERLGIEVSRKYLAAADLVLFCRDAGCEMRDTESQEFLASCRAPVVEVMTKIDLMEGPNARRPDRRGDAGRRPGSGVRELLRREVMSDVLLADPANRRHVFRPPRPEAPCVIRQVSVPMCHRGTGGSSRVRVRRARLLRAGSLR